MSLLQDRTTTSQFTNCTWYKLHNICKVCEQDEASTSGDTTSSPPRWPGRGHTRQLTLKNRSEEASEWTETQIQGEQNRRRAMMWRSTAVNMWGSGGYKRKCRKINYRKQNCEIPSSLIWSFQLLVTLQIQITQCWCSRTCFPDM